MMATIRFSDYAMKQIMEDTGLSKLELLGVIAAMNKHTTTPEQIREYERAEARGDYI